MPPHALLLAPCLYKPVINSFVCIVLPSVLAADKQCYLTEGSETTQTYRPLWFEDPPCYGGVPPGGVDSLGSFLFGNTEANVQRERERGSITLDQPFNITTNENSLVPPISTISAQNPSVSSTTLLLPQVQPALLVHKYQCTTCLRKFDRESRLENCHNRHSGVKPHRCFGVCGTVGWYVIPQFILPPQHLLTCLTGSLV